MHFLHYPFPKVCQILQVCRHGPRLQILKFKNNLCCWTQQIKRICSIRSVQLTAHGLTSSSILYKFVLTVNLVSAKRTNKEKRKKLWNAHKIPKVNRFISSIWFYPGWTKAALLLRSQESWGLLIIGQPDECVGTEYGFSAFLTIPWLWFSRWCHKRELAALESWTFGLHFCTMGSCDAPSIFNWLLYYRYMNVYSSREPFLAISPRYKTQNISQPGFKLSLTSGWRW